MANYNKSFNFRNGVQVDVQSLLVNSNGLVGIGTTIPRTDLDVYGDFAVTGLITAKNIFSSGIATFSTIKVGSAITMDSISGIVSAAVFFGDGSQLRGIPTSQWVDYTGPGLSSAYTLRNLVGIGSSAVSSSFQVGGRFEYDERGVGISSSGDIAASGIITSSLGFYGPGQNITSINASNISFGTLNNSRLPNNINLPTGIATVGTVSFTNAKIGISTLNSNGIITKNITGTSFTGGSFYATEPIEVSSSSTLLFSGGSGISIAGNTGTAGQFFVANGSGGISWADSISLSGVTTVGLLSARDISVSGFTTTGKIKAASGTITNLVTNYLSGVFAGNIENLYSIGFSTIINLTVENLNSTGISTVSFLNIINGTASTLTVESLSGNSSLGSLSAGIATITKLISSYSETGFTTTTQLNASNINATGIVTGSSLVAGNIKINDSANKIETVSGNLTIGNLSGSVSISNDLIASRNVNITGITTTTQLNASNINATGIVTGSSLVAGNIKINNSLNKIETVSGNLTIGSQSNKIIISNDLDVSGNTNLSGITTVSIGLIPDQDKDAYLGSNSKSFANAYIEEIKIGANANTIDTRTGSLKLNSINQYVETLNDFKVNRNSYVSGISTFNNIAVLNIGLVPSSDNTGYLGQDNNSFSAVHVGEINLGYDTSNTISTRSINLKLDSYTKTVEVLNDLVVDRNLSITGVSTFSGILKSSVGLLPTVANGSYLGSSSFPFSSLYVQNVNIGDSGATNTISTKSGNLSLDAITGIVTVASNLRVGGTTVLSGITSVTSGLLPTTNLTGSLGSSSKSFSSAYLSNVRVTVADANTIDTSSGDLKLNSFSGNVTVSKLQVSGISNFSNSVIFGNTAQVFIDSSNSKVGIGTSIPRRNIQVYSSGSEASIEAISDTVGRVNVGQLSQSGYSRKIGSLIYGLDTNSLGIINYDVGDVNFYIHSGNSGINTGGFNWIYGQDNTKLLSLTYDGNLGLGITNPTTKLHVVGTSTITGNAFFGGNVSIAGTLYPQSINLPSIISNTNINNTSGISTFYDITVNNVSTASTIITSFIGINTTAPKVDIDVATSTMLIESIGIGTIGLSSYSKYDAGIGEYESVTPSLQLFESNFLINTGKLLLLNPSSIGSYEEICAIGINTYVPKSVLDFGEVGAASTIAGYFVPPKISTTDRDKNSNLTGIGGTVEGAIIYNKTTKKHQGYGSTNGGTTFSWIDLY